MAYKGKFIPKNPHKYIGNVDKIVFRSLWERKFFWWCDTTKSVLKWCSEEVVVPYISPVDKQYHRYFTDVYVEQLVDGELIKRLIEIKPQVQTRMPIKKGRNTRKYVNELKTYAVNQAKWRAADIYAKKRGWKFEILTEKELKIKK